MKNKPLNIHIPEPCHEDWNKMSKTEKGKFCSKCTQEVYDFTQYSEEQLSNIINEHREKRIGICGQFNANQLNQENNTFKIPFINNTFSLQQIFALALFFIFLLPGCKVIDRTSGAPMFLPSRMDYLNSLNNCESNQPILINYPHYDGAPIILPIKKDSIIINDSISIKEMYSYRFDINSDTLTNRAIIQLDSLIDKLNKVNNYSLEVVGHSDNVGSFAYNKALSERRAQSVADYLKKNGIEIKDVRGVGYQYPIKDNTSEVGRASNRRVEILIKLESDSSKIEH